MLLNAKNLACAMALSWSLTLPYICEEANDQCKSRFAATCLRPQQSMVGPIYTFFGVYDLRHLWRSGAWSSIQSISFLPRGPPAEVAWSVSMTRATANIPSLFRSFSSLCKDIGYPVRTDEIMWDGNFATGFREATDALQDKDSASFVAINRCDPLHHIKWSKQESTLLRHTYEPGRRFPLRPFSGLHDLNSFTIFNGTLKGTPTLPNAAIHVSFSARSANVVTKPRYTSLLPVKHNHV